MTNLSKQPSKTWFVGRHSGSAEWLRAQDIRIDKHVEHLDKQQWPSPGDTVIGTLPVHIIADLNHQGVRFIHLKLDMKSTHRGEEFNAADLQKLNPELVEYLVMRIGGDL